MIVTGNVPAGEAPACPPGTRLLATIDVEWSKNYRVKDGNVPFCFSVAWLALPAGRWHAVTDTTRFWYTSAYVEDDRERGDLISAADAALEVHRQPRKPGHRAPAVQRPRRPGRLSRRATAGDRGRGNAWRQRRRPLPGQPRYLDTRYDAGHVLACQSRRLVDVCADLRLDVTQPELRGASMTALHRRWTEHGDTTAREKITVLNLRHSLSTAIVAARAAGLAPLAARPERQPAAGRRAGQRIGWTASPAFTALLGEPGAA